MARAFRARIGACPVSYHFTQFFSLDSPKAIKARSFGYLNAINYMAPASIAGVGDMCPWSSVACRALCLGEHSGQAAMHKEGETNAVLESRKAKTVMFMRARAQFMRELAAGIGRASRKAQREGLQLCVRLNGATDINWVATIKQYPDIQFVDYTKSEARALAHAQGKLPANYHVTFSFAGDNHDACKRVLAAGGNVAVCFYTGSKKAPIAFPATWFGFPVVDGDLSDLRHLDPRGVVVGLSPKGAKAKRDGRALGFVVDAQ
jgi:hypothetical protein